MRELRVGIVGYGMRRTIGLLAHRPSEGSRVVAVCDPSSRARDQARTELGPETRLHAELAPFLHEDLDAVFVLTPDDLHREHAVATLRAGIATFLEKPLATTVAGCDEILTTARDTGTRLYVGHNMRHMPVVVTMRQLIESGRIGTVKAVWCRHFISAGGDYYFKDWHSERSRTTSLLLQKGAHDLDVIHWLAGGYSTRVSAHGGLTVYGDCPDRRDNSDRLMGEWLSVDNWPPTEQKELAPVIDVEDLSLAVMTLDNGVHASYQQCHFTPDYWRNYTVIGTHGRLENDGDDLGAVVRVWTRRTDRRSDADEVVPVPITAGDHGGADPRLVAEFLAFVRDGGRTDTSPVAARQAVAAGVAATMSLRGRGDAVDVPPVDPELVRYFEEGQRR